ncbi:hypothetical protein [Herbaspirillum rhizosphaerae]|uniref:hypothetical protein n=1 Tax=Herbaspirillum rhizosphaerae TaxID=346179 RepID=UPI00067C2CEF|nr:hypothetical protein [Herbaspirillum rhizosphaerae]
MSHSDFEAFAIKHKAKFKRISAATKGEYEAEDVIGEAWLMAEKMRIKQGSEIDFHNPAHIDLLFSYLYQHLVNYTEKQVRMAVRLDAWDYGDDPEHDCHPLLNKLSSDNADNPLTVLELKETAAAEHAVNPHHSRAAAYLKLLGHCDNNIAQLANYLLISTSWCYRCYNRAKHTVERQRQLPETMKTDFMPRTWRKFQLFRKMSPQQRSFNFLLPWEG